MDPGIRRLPDTCRLPDIRTGVVLMSPGALTLLGIPAVRPLLGIPAVRPVPGGRGGSSGPPPPDG